MTTVPDKVLNWLYSVLTSEYHDVNRTYSDVARSLSHYHSLSPRTEVYTYENGASALLLLISGTLPVTFRGTVYRFPLALWIPHAYPKEAPIVYVTPVRGMVVRPGQHVSPDGKVYHPYLAQWNQYWDKSSLLDFLEVLRGVFAKEPPVRSRQEEQFAPRPQQQAPPPRPPPPEELKRSVQPPQSASSSSESRPPPRPPKPHEISTPTASPYTGTPVHNQGAPPIPPLPPHAMGERQATPNSSRQGYTHQYPQHQGNSQYPQRQVSLDDSLSRPPPQPTPLRMQTQHLYQAQQHELGSPVSPITPEHLTLPHANRYSQAPPPQQPSFHPPGQQLQHSSQSMYQQSVPFQRLPSNVLSHQAQLPYMGPPKAQAQQPKKQQPIEDLLSSPLDVTIPSQTGKEQTVAPPPIPPNPEKDALLKAISSTLCNQIQHTISDNMKAIQPLQIQQTSLREAYSRLQNELDQLQQLDSVLASNEQILRQAMHEADRVMNDARNRKVPDVDEVLVAPTVVGGQLYNLCAEERACADAIFVLGRGLDKGRIGVDVFIKQTRSLAREQFLKKALIKKIARGMGLDSDQAWRT
ncbi:UEV-domain-containing protein [Patellaria atrata CBS 101060]|uniref:UEV-domain-containing protein n=1 Tax=Patellaria atrata CBS 101060 TaxID=1346257 RepID=A0A9P4VSC3_9PEZI|nr:UEV-domain-containing protein [Patellaria atrata CBS 101060]